MQLAPAMPGAENVLRAASQASAYVASMTPQEDLEALLAQRGWLPLLKGAFGYPKAKADVVADLLRRHGIAPAQLIVIGDGISDRTAAERNGCAFHAITSPQSLLRIPGLRTEDHA